VSTLKVYKKGEVIFKEGDKLNCLHLIQAGSVNLVLQKPKKTIEVMLVGAGQVLGEQVYLGASPSNLTAVAQTEAKILEISGDDLKNLVDSSNPVVKLFTKSLVERMKLSMNEVRSARLEKDASPCADDQVAQTFGAIFHTANHKGVKDEKNPQQTSLEWILMKQYSQRVFGVSPRRLEQAVILLKKLSLAQIEMGKPPENPDGPDEMIRVQILDLSAVENFFEFWQYFYFKNGRTEVLKFDESMNTLVSALLKLGGTLTPDRFGVVSLELSKGLEFLKTEIQSNVSNDHFLRLEQKGVMTKRAPQSDGTVFLKFEPREILGFSRAWRIIREVDRWNEKGFVDPVDEDLKAKKQASSGVACPKCSTEVNASAKFCPECGCKIEMAKAG
jgi:hypothetical protein